MAERPIVLSIAGYDPSSGAGITADVKTAAACDCYAMTCATALTVQTTQGVFGVEPVRPEVVRETVNRLADDVDFAAVRIGMLGSGAVAEVVAEFLQQRQPRNVVLDPVMRSSSGAELIDQHGVAVMRREILPRVTVATPNLTEAVALVGSSALPAGSEGVVLGLWRELAGKLHGMGCPAIAITSGDQQEANDYLSIWREGRAEEHVLAGSRMESKATHGTGCAFATALACGLAKGQAMAEAARGAKEFVRRAIAAAYPVGKGYGPMNHLFRLDE